MEVEGLNDNGYYTYQTVKTKKRQSEFDTALFMKLLTSQLTHQDPFEPMSNTELYDSIAKLANVDTQDKMNKKLTELTESLSTMNAASMIGKTVIGPTTDTGDLVTGRVVKIVSKEGDYILGVRTTDGLVRNVNLASIKEIS